MWSQQDIENIIKDFNTKNGGTTGGFSVPYHWHNGSDSAQIQASDLIPYNFVTEAPVTTGTQAFGTMFLFQPDPLNIAADAGMYIFLNGNWNYNSYVADGVFAVRSSAQSIPSSVSTIIICDTVEWDDSGEYNTTTGKYGDPNGIDQGGKYLISLQATFEPGAAGATPLFLTFVVDNGSSVTAEHQSFVVDNAGNISISMTLVKNFGTGIIFWFEILHAGAGARNLQANNTFLSVKKFSN